MLRLDLKTEPEWLNLGHGVQVFVSPLTTAIMMAARKEVERQIPMPDDTELADVAALDTDSIGLAMAKAVARITITDWDGVGDANGDPVPVSPEGIDALLDIWPIFEAFQTSYIAHAMILDAEKNASPPLLNGNSAGAETIAEPARSRKAARAGAKTARKS